MDDRTEGLLRSLAPQVLGAVVRRYGHFDLAEDAVQEAMLAAATQWPKEGVPDRPKGWLITAASRRLTDLLRSEQARRDREDVVAQWKLSEEWVMPAADRPSAVADDTLILLFMCCHPSLSAASQIALTLRAVGGLSTAEIARALLTSEVAMTRRISRAKQDVKASRLPFRLPATTERADRLGVVLRVLYLIFNEGYVATSGPSLHRVELSGEAIRLTRMLHRSLPENSEVTGLLALMLLTDARRPARTAADGELVPMADQNRSLWDPELITEGVDLVTAALSRGPVGPYQLQAAIAAVHDEAPSYQATDWPQILALYSELITIADSPVVRLNHAVAVTMVHGADAGLSLLDQLEDVPQLVGDHRLPTVRAHLLEMAGQTAAARQAYLAAAEQTASLPQQRYLHRQAARLTPPDR